MEAFIIAQITLFGGNTLTRCDDIEVAEPTQQSTASSGLDTLTDHPIDSKGTDTIKGHRDGGRYAKIDEEQPGTRPPGGLLAVPHVKIVLFLVCVVQVRTYPAMGDC